jgi:hypothetical protein
LSARLHINILPREAPHAFSKVLQTMKLIAYFLGLPAPRDGGTSACYCLNYSGGVKGIGAGFVRRCGRKESLTVAIDS